MPHPYRTQNISRKLKDFATAGSAKSQQLARQRGKWAGDSGGVYTFKAQNASRGHTMLPRDCSPCRSREMGDAA